MSYDRTALADVVEEFCARTDESDPSNIGPPLQALSGLGRHIRVTAKNGVVVHARATWADDQTGCGTKADFYFNDDSDPSRPKDYRCKTIFDSDYYCDPRHELNEAEPRSAVSWGGAYVFNSQAGCILIEQYATESDSGASSMSRFTSVGNNITDHSFDSITFLGNSSRFGVWDHAEALKYPHVFNLTAIDKA